MGKLWFVCCNQVVTGPLQTEQVQSRMETGEWTSNAFIWWKGQREWLPLHSWAAELEGLLAVDDNAVSPVWYVDMGFAAPLGPVTVGELVKILQGTAEIGATRVWTAAMTNWKPIYEVPQVMDLLNISRRETDRAPLMGAVIISRPLDGLAPLLARAASISLGGMGLNGAADLRKGDECQLLVKSLEFPAGLHLQGHVVYVMSTGYAGIKFVRPNSEAQSLIHDYIRRFQRPAAGQQSAA